MATRRKASTATVVEETDDAFEDLDEVEEIDDVEEEPPAKRGRGTKKTATAPAKATNELGSVWLAEHVSEATGKQIDSRGIRMYLRKLAKADDSPLGRSVGEDRGRYAFKGPNDPAVKAIVRMVKETEAKPPRAATRKAKDAEEPAEETTPRRRVAKKTTAAAAPAKATPAKRARRRATADAE